MTDVARLDSGRFWLPDAPGGHVGGWLDVVSRWPQLTLADPLTAAMRVTERTAGPDGQVTTMWVPADDEVEPDAFTVHGHLRRGPRRITLIGATSAGRSMVFGGTGADRGEQRLRADYALVGGHVDGDASFDRVRLRMSHLDEWARLPGLTTTIGVDGSRVLIEYADPDEERAPVPGLGELVLATVVTMPQPSVRGANLVRRAELRLELAEPLAFEEIWQRFVAPATTLLNLCVDRNCHIADLQLRTGPDEPWLQVCHPMIDTTAPGPGDHLASHEVAFPREAVTLHNVAKWLTHAADLSPIPGVVTAIRTESERTLANQLLELATAAEGLHRRLPDQPRVITRAQAKAARRAARDAVDPSMRDRVNDTLGHLDDPTYAERLHAITDLAEASIPEVLGDRETWEQRIRQVRNGFAHQVPATSASHEWKEYLVLLRTLRWVLIAVLLNRAGVATDVIGQRLRDHEPYLFQLRQARRWTPDLYPAPRPEKDGVADRVDP